MLTSMRCTNGRPDEDSCSDKKELALAVERERQAHEAGDRVADAMTRRLQEWSKEREEWEANVESLKCAWEDERRQLAGQTTGHIRDLSETR